jgi:hypothetical protein
VGDLHHLDLVELVLADHAARVAPGAAGLGPEARRVRGELDGQLGLGHDLVAHKVGQRHFAGRDQVQRGVVSGGFALLPALLGGEQVALKLGQLAGAAQRVGVDDVGHIALGVAVLLRLHVQHELRQRAVQAGDRPLHHGEARARQLDAHSKSRPSGVADVHMVLDAKSSARGLCPSCAHHVAMLVRAHGHAGVRQVGHGQQQGVAARTASAPGARRTLSSSPLRAFTCAITASALRPWP